MEERIRISYCPYSLIFKEPGGTSRGILKSKETYFLKIESKEKGSVSYGEVPFFPGLSEETAGEVEKTLKECSLVTTLSELPKYDRISSLIFGFEQALGCLNTNDHAWLFPSNFTQGKNTILINGLVWMGPADKMKHRVDEKINDGYSCIKIKIGAIRWDEEINLIKYIRDKAGSEIEIRVDANGAFSPSECMKRLEDLARYKVHSIEQPLQKGQLTELRKICRESPIAIALDEELIGWRPDIKRTELLEYLRPEFIILKPALCYGFSGALDWIERAKALNIDYWITSALESNVGLDAIAQFTGKLEPVRAQGLGTGNLFYNNFKSPLKLKSDKLYFIGPAQNYRLELEKLPWQNG